MKQEILGGHQYSSKRGRIAGQRSSQCVQRLIRSWAQLGWPGGEHLLVLNCFEHLLAMIHIKTFQCTALHAIQYTMHCILFNAMHCNWLQRIAIHWACIELCRELLTLDHTELLHDVKTEQDLNRWPQDRGCAQFTDPMHELHAIEGLNAIEQFPN